MPSVSRRGSDPAQGRHEVVREDRHEVSKLLKLHGMLVLTVHPDFTLAEASRRFVKSVGGRRFSLAVVTNHDDHVVGVISLATSPRPWPNTRRRPSRCW